MSDVKGVRIVCLYRWIKLICMFILNYIFIFLQTRIKTLECSSRADYRALCPEWVVEVRVCVQTLYLNDEWVTEVYLCTVRVRVQEIFIKINLLRRDPCLMYYSILSQKDCFIKNNSIIVFFINLPCTLAPTVQK